MLIFTQILNSTHVFFLSIHCKFLLHLVTFRQHTYFIWHTEFDHFIDCGCWAGCCSWRWAMDSVIWLVIGSLWYGHSLNESYAVHFSSFFSMLGTGYICHFVLVTSVYVMSLNCINHIILFTVIQALYKRLAIWFRHQLIFLSPNFSWHNM